MIHPLMFGAAGMFDVMFLNSFFEYCLAVILTIENS